MSTQTTQYYNPLNNIKEVYPRYTLRDDKVVADGEEVSEVTFTFLADHGESRCLFPKDYDPTSKPLCKADDGENPNGGVQQKTGPCSVCPENKWGKDANGKSIPPRCTAAKNLLCYDHERQLVFVLPLKRTGLSLLATLRNALKSAMARVQPKAPWGNAPALAVRFKYSTKKTRSEKFKKDYYMPSITLLDVLPESEAPVMLAIAESENVEIAQPEECLPQREAPIRESPIDDIPQTQSDEALSAELGARAKTVIRRGQREPDAAPPQDLPF